MPSDLAKYLATRYLVADPKPSSKKRKRKRHDPSGLLITDDNDDSAWAHPQHGDDEQDDDGPTTVVGTTAEFRKAKKSGWKKAGGSEAEKTDKAAADAVIAAAVAETQAATAAEDEAPVIEDALVMSDGTHAGIQSPAAIKAQLERRRRQKQEESMACRQPAQEQETVYRDATGTRIDISMKRAEARRAALEAEQKELQAKDVLKGEAQLQEARRRKDQLSDAMNMPFARKADDDEMNKELKERERWNDPAAQFLGDKNETAGTGKKRSKRHPTYAGAAPPNRYGIRPGYRWDGVDRTNGFEANRFKAMNRQERNKSLAYSWQMDE
ncbi:hypothetical protein L249_4925 [Ophiocordyceps polyrhachis-furcata BCC 54312]|uniref:Pre-mRNA-splicing factor CWC26 n=1 Tax=Ophiocordyceps polyrhachis-furcata BCC 54312 TaxID=1330021 RepID=A0A367L3A3_9HYPO|nr:hypothetical protein L249_4925 [Ophiocordyceps polyrhachis-furcata BCC 54312]